MADPQDEKPRVLYEQGNAAHRLRVEHDHETLLVHLSDEDGGDGRCSRSIARRGAGWSPRPLASSTLRKDAYGQLHGGA